MSGAPVPTPASMQLRHTPPVGWRPLRSCKLFFLMLSFDSTCALLLSFDHTTRQDKAADVVGVHLMTAGYTVHLTCCQLPSVCLFTCIQWAMAMHCKFCSQLAVVLLVLPPFCNAPPSTWLPQEQCLGMHRGQLADIGQIPMAEQTAAAA